MKLRWHFGRKCRYQLTFIFVFENVMWHFGFEVECQMKVVKHTHYLRVIHSSTLHAWTRSMQTSWIQWMRTTTYIWTGWVISICEVSIDVWDFFFTRHTTCQNLNCACQLTCILCLSKLLHVKYQKLAKNLSKIHIALKYLGQILLSYYYQVFDLKMKSLGTATNTDMRLLHLWVV
jgi:hypothetical protein